MVKIRSRPVIPSFPFGGRCMDEPQVCSSRDLRIRKLGILTLPLPTKNIACGTGASQLEAWKVPLSIILSSEGRRRTDNLQFLLPWREEVGRRGIHNLRGRAGKRLVVSIP
jgi:hypothetical protein